MTRTADNGHFLTKKQAKEYAGLPIFDTYGTFTVRENGKGIPAAAYPLSRVGAELGRDKIRHPGYLVSIKTRSGSHIEVYFTPEQIAAALIGIAQSEKGE